MWDMQKVFEAFYSIYGELLGVDFEVEVRPKNKEDEQCPAQEIMPSEVTGAISAAGPFRRAG